jgi:hypothetical protein
MHTIHRILVLMVVLVIAAGMSSADNKFVGVTKCKVCHSVEKMGGLAYKVWEKTAHAKAFESLKTKEAEEFAKKKGLKTPASESPECLKCHVAGGGTAPEVKKEEGVSCEACHGAGSGYLNLHNKKTPEDKEKAKAAGLILEKDKSGKLCEKCHNAESPTFKGFTFAEMWKKIEHSGPKK